MITVEVRKDRITVCGHAQYESSGKDIVCAGVTALVTTLIDSITGLTNDKIQYEIMPGWADIHFRDLSEESMLLVDSFFLGVCNIANEFPDHVRIM